jgi:hypothetical protein
MNQISYELINTLDSKYVTNYNGFILIHKGIATDNIYLNHVILTTKTKEFNLPTQKQILKYIEKSSNETLTLTILDNRQHNLYNLYVNRLANYNRRFWFLVHGESVNNILFNTESKLESL